MLALYAALHKLQYAKLNNFQDRIRNEIISVRNLTKKVQEISWNGM